MKQAEIKQLLPEIFQRAVHPGNPLFAVLSVMEVLQAPSENILQNLETHFDPRRSPDRFVAYLASWVDLDRLLSTAPVPTSARPDPASAILCTTTPVTVTWTPSWPRKCQSSSTRMRPWPNCM